MADSLIEQLPKIVAEGKKEVERILERLSGSNKLTLKDVMEFAKLTLQKVKRQLF